jgi:hypothetical protein
VIEQRVKVLLLESLDHSPQPFRAFLFEGMSKRDECRGGGWDSRFEASEKCDSHIDVTNATEGSSHSPDVGPDVLSVISIDEFQQLSNAPRRDPGIVHAVRITIAHPGQLRSQGAYLIDKECERGG